MGKKTIQSQIAQFRVDLIRELPFYGEMLSHFEIIESKAFPTAATDGRVIYYNLSFFRELSEGQRNFVLLHELLHIILLHPFRADGKNVKLWGIAADYVVNGLVMQLIWTYQRMRKHAIPFEEPPCGFFLTGYCGQSAEQLYYILEQEVGKIVKFLRNKIIVAIVNELGETEDKEVTAKDLDLILKLSKSESEMMEDQIRSWMSGALKNWTDDPSVEMISQQLFLIDRARILPWKRILKRFLRESEETDVSYDHPERKYLHMDLILPGEGRETENNTLEDVWAFIDTSGSISANEKNNFITQLYRICKQFHAKINIGYWDVAMHEVYRNVTDTNILNATTGHRGGTDATAVYDYLDRNRIRASVILILTDGCFERVDPARLVPYRKKTIVVLSDSSWGEYYCSEMGKIASLDMN